MKHGLSLYVRDEIWIEEKGREDEEMRIFQSVDEVLVISAFLFFWRGKPDRLEQRSKQQRLELLIENDEKISAFGDFGPRGLHSALQEFTRVVQKSILCF